MINATQHHKGLLFHYGATGYLVFVFDDRVKVCSQEVMIYLFYSIIMVFSHICISLVMTQPWKDFCWTAVFLPCLGILTVWFNLHQSARYSKTHILYQDFINFTRRSIVCPWLRRYRYVTLPFSARREKMFRLHFCL